MKRYWQNWLWITPLAALAVARVHPVYAFGGEPADEAVDALGVLLLLAGVGMRVCARGWKVEAGSQGLVTDGLYGYVRHPLYVGSLLTGLGLCAILGVYWFAFAFAVCFVAGHGPAICREEAELARRWPDRHSDYRKRVPALVPGLRQLMQSHPIRPRRLGEAVAREADAVCLWPLAAVSLEIWEETSVAALRYRDLELTALAALAVSLGVAWVLLKCHWARRGRLLFGIGARSRWSWRN
jgi:protein-S-isoprenylcysteine O-methyltransferase Ste14